MMKKLALVYREMYKLISAHKLYFLAPLILSLVVVIFLFVKLGPGIVMTFIYAGV